MAFLAVTMLLLALGAARAVPSEQAAVADAQAARVALPRFNVTLGLGNRRLRFIPPPPPPIVYTALARSLVDELRFTQILDHFNPKDKRTWKQVGCSGGAEAVFEPRPAASLPSCCASPLPWLDSAALLRPHGPLPRRWPHLHLHRR